LFAVRVQKNIPMPMVTPRGFGGTAKPKYPWRTMDVGDSFLFPERIGRAGYAAALQASKYTGRLFKVCRMDDGYRCWRVF
jgi:hypothetical protein